MASTIFSFAYAAAYRPLPVPEGDRVMHLEQEDPSRGRQELRVGYHDFLDWRTQQTAFEDLAAFYTGTVNLSGDGRPERFFGGFITANAFDALRGRLFWAEGPSLERTGPVHPRWPSSPIPSGRSATRETRRSWGGPCA